MKIDKILVPTDFSSASDEAMRAACDLAERIGHQIIVLHAFVPPIYPLLDGAVIPTAQHVADLVNDADRQVKALCDRFERAGVAIEGKVVQGAAAEEILAFADREGCDLIVMGTHGRSGVRRLVLGSIAESVVRGANIPVLTIREHPPAQPDRRDAAPVI
jgi:nucleotide-binding universal stress UspA family protein